MKKEQHFYHAKLFLETYSAALTVIEMDFRNQSRKKHNKAAKIGYVPPVEAQYFERQKASLEAKQHNLNQFTNGLFYKFLPRFMYSRDYRAMFQELQTAVTNLRREVGANK